MELGRTQKLEIVRMVDFGAYLGTEEEQVLLPKKQVPEGANVGIFRSSHVHIQKYNT